MGNPLTDGADGIQARSCIRFADHAARAVPESSGTTLQPTAGTGERVGSGISALLCR
jgi:hypothetical protein